MKPKYLYHASPNVNIEVLEPRAESVRDEGEGAVVFATDDKAYASCFLISTDDSWSKISSYQFKRNGMRVWVMFITDEERFKYSDKECAIYILPSETFTIDIEKHAKEWISKEPVKPISKEIYSGAIDAMIENDVQIYYISKEQLESLKVDPSDVAFAINMLKSLISENDRRGKINLIKKYF